MNKQELDEVIWKKASNTMFGVLKQEHVEVKDTGIDALKQRKANYRKGIKALGKHKKRRMH